MANVIVLDSGAILPPEFSGVGTYVMDVQAMMLSAVPVWLQSSVELDRPPEFPTCVEIFGNIFAAYEDDAVNTLVVTNLPEHEDWARVLQLMGATVVLSGTGVCDVS